MALQSADRSTEMNGRREKQNNSKGKSKNAHNEKTNAKTLTQPAVS